MSRVLEARSTGVEPMLLNPGVIRPIAASGWEAELTQLRAMDASVDLLTISPHEYDSSMSRVRFRPAVLLVAVETGRLNGTVGDEPFEVLPGQALLLDTRVPLVSQVFEDSRVLRTVFDQRRLGTHLFHGLPKAGSVLADSPVTESCLAAAGTLLRRGEASALEDDDTAIVQLLVGMQLSLLAESRRQQVLHDGLAGEASRRERIERYIEAHLEDPELSPPRIAESLGVSVRSVHAAFDGTADTVGRVIRRQRVQRVQDSVRDLPALPHVEELAVTHGFRGPSHLARTFRAVTGASLPQWYSDHRSGGSGC